MADEAFGREELDPDETSAPEAGGRYLLPPASCRRRIMDSIRPDWLDSTTDDLGVWLMPDVEMGATACTTGVVAEIADPFGIAALRSPVRTRSVAGGSADLPADNARRRASAASRPLDEFKEAAGMETLSLSAAALTSTGAVDNEGSALRLGVIVVAEQAHMMGGIGTPTRLKLSEDSLH